MRLIDKPHCKKHEVYEQGCIGCRIKAKPKFGTLAEFGTPVELDVISSKEFMKRAGYKPRSTQVSDLVAADPDKHHGAFKSAKKKEQVIKQFLKDVYRDGALGNKRNLQDDMETLQRLVQQNAGHKA